MQQPWRLLGFFLIHSFNMHFENRGHTQVHTSGSSVLPLSPRQSQVCGVIAGMEKTRVLGKQAEAPPPDFSVRKGFLKEVTSTPMFEDQFLTFRVDVG